jgi:hypothetical protein
MNPHDHDHAHGDQHPHGHEALHPHRHSRVVVGPSGNPELAPNGTHGATHHHRMDSRLNPPPRGNDGQFGSSLLMTSSWSRVLGALGLIALLWLAVAWAVLFID